MEKRISGLKPLLIFIVIAVIVAAVGFRWWYNPSAGNSKVVERIIKSADIKEFSIGGEVVEINKAEGQLTFKTGWVQETANGKEFIYTTRSIIVLPQTKIQSISKDGVSTTVTNKDPLVAFRVGDKIIVYGSGNPITSTTLLADKIEIQR